MDFCSICLIFTGDIIRELNVPGIKQINVQIHDKKHDDDKTESFSLGTAAAIGAMLGALKRGPNANLEENFDEVMKLIASMQLPKVSN